MSARPPAPLLVLGLGNVLCGDDGLGVAGVRRLERGYAVPETVRVLDGGTLGLSLLRFFEGMDDVLLVDAVRLDAPPGTLVHLEGDDVAPAVRERLSVHQVGVVDLLDSLRLLGSYPRRLTLLGLVPRTLELGVSRSTPVEQALPRLTEAIAAEIRRRGHAIRARSGNGTAPHPVDDDDVGRALGM